MQIKYMTFGDRIDSDHDCVVIAFDKHKKYLGAWPLNDEDPLSVLIQKLNLHGLVELEELDIPFNFYNDPSDLNPPVTFMTVDGHEFEVYFNGFSLCEARLVNDVLILRETDEQITTERLVQITIEATKSFVGLTKVEKG